MLLSKQTIKQPHSQLSELLFSSVCHLNSLTADIFENRHLFTGAGHEGLYIHRLPSSRLWVSICLGVDPSLTTCLRACKHCIHKSSGKNGDSNGPRRRRRRWHFCSSSSAWWKQMVGKGFIVCKGGDVEQQIWNPVLVFFYGCNT